MAWILTDDSSNQYVKKIDDDTFEIIDTFAMVIPGVYEVHTDTIYLPDYAENYEDYPEGETVMIIKTFGYTGLEEVVAEYGDSANQIIAECIFEHYARFATEPVFVGTFKECADFIYVHICDDYGKEDEA